MRLTEQKQIYLDAYAESYDALQRYEIKSVNSEILYN